MAKADVRKNNDVAYSRKYSDNGKHFLVFGRLTERAETAHRQIGLYRRGKDKPDLFCRVGAAATAGGQSRVDGEGLPQQPSTQQTDVTSQKRPASRPSGEASEDYPDVVAVIDGGRSRVIVCSAGIQWIVQHWQTGRWRLRSHCRTKEALLRCCGNDPHPALAALPERIGDRVAPTADTQEAAE